MRVINAASNTIVKSLDSVDNALDAVNYGTETISEIMQIAALEAKASRMETQLECNARIAELEKKLALAES